MTRPFSVTILSCWAVIVGVSASPTSTVTVTSVTCENPRATICSIKKLPEVPAAGPTIVLPDLSRRTELRVKDGTLRNLTEAMIGPTGTNLRVLRLKQLGMESVFVLPNFEELHLAQNRLSAIVVLDSASGFALKKCDLQNNQLKNVTQLAPFKLLEELNLDDNAISELPMGLFEQMLNLRELSLARNGLTKVTTPAGSGEFVLPSLERLSLAYNELPIIRMDRWQLPSLQSLLLNDNKLVELPELGSFERFPELERIALAGNSWSCAWLVLALPEVMFDLANDTETNSQKDCTFENVAGICCQFTETDATVVPSELFLPEIETVKKLSTLIDERHAEYLRNGTKEVAHFATLVSQMLDKLHKLVQSNEPQEVTAEQVLIMCRSVNVLEQEVSKVEKSTNDILATVTEQKRMIHLMLDMNNNLVRQAIEMDTILDLVDQEKVAFDRWFEARLAP